MSETTTSPLHSESLVADDGVAVNELLPVLKKTGSPDKKVIKGVFDRYEEKQRPRAKACATFSGYVTRFESMDTWLLRFLRAIYSWFPGSLRARVLMDIMGGAPILNFLPDPDKGSS